MTLLTETLSIAGVLGVIYFFLVLTDVEKRPSYVVALFRSLPVGIMLILSMMIVNSLVEGRWDYNYILDFLLLKEVGRWLFRILVGLGYILIVLGVASILALVVKRIAWNKR